MKTIYSILCIQSNQIQSKHHILSAKNWKRNKIHHTHVFSMVSKVLSLRHRFNPPFRSYCKSHKSSATGKGMYGSLLQKLTERGGECGTPTQNIWIASLSGLCQVAVGIIRPSVWRPGSAVMWPWLIVTSVFWVKEQTICHNERQHKFIVGCEYRHHCMQLQLQAKTNKQRKGKKNTATTLKDRNK